MRPPIETVLERLDGVKKAGGAFKARCPAHADQSPSLSIKEGDDGRVLLHCFASCEVQAVVEALGLQMSDLFVQNPPDTSKKVRPAGVNVRDLLAAAEFERQVLYIVKSDQASGKSVSQADWERAKLALRRIALVRRVL
jgi:hypothetical protein